MNNIDNFNYEPDPQEFDHVDDWTDDDFDEEEEDFEEDEDCASTSGCMPDPEDFDD